MTGFSAEWLSLRAPADAAARDRGLERRLIDWAAGRALKVTDLGGGSGAAYRALSPHLPGARWRIIDDDAALLAKAAKSPGVETAEINLADDLVRAFTPKPDLITGFAFFDLVSEAWMTRLIDLAKASDAAIYAPLIYNGEETWRPEPAHEAAALAAFNADMTRDKGFGPALGPAAATRLASIAKNAGYHVWTANSPWRLSVGPLLIALAEGGAEPVGARLSKEETATWLAGRIAANSAVIGHTDILAVPA